jgi:hypothetical protein
LGKRGPKKTTTKREQNGRRSRKQKDQMEHFMQTLELTQRDTLGVGLNARHKVFGVAPQHTRDQKAGSAIGRFCLQGHITQAQYDAAMMFLEARERNLRAIDAPPQPGAVNLNATHGRPIIVENAGQVRKWRENYKAACAAIQEKQNEIRLMGNLFGALDAVLVRDIERDMYLGDLRTALNALVKHYGLLARAA